MITPGVPPLEVPRGVAPGIRLRVVFFFGSPSVFFLLKILREFVQDLIQLVLLKILEELS